MISAARFAASEGMAFGLPAGQLSQSPNIHSWWDAAKLREIESFKAQCNELTLRILPCSAAHMGLPASFFAASHNQSLPGNALKFMKYPKMPAEPGPGVLVPGWRRIRTGGPSRCCLLRRLGWKCGILGIAGMMSLLFRVGLWLISATRCRFGRGDS